MLEVYEPGAAIIEDSVANAVGRLTKTNKCALDFASRAQKAMLEEMIFASNEIFDRIRDAPVQRICLENGRLAFGQGPENDVRGM